MIGLHVTIVSNYGSYSTVKISKSGKARIYFQPGELPTQTAIQVTCAKCGKQYFIKYRIAKR